MAFNSSDDIDIVIRVTADGAIRVLNQTGKEIDKIGDSVNKTEPKIGKLENSIASIGRAALTAGAAIKGIQVAITSIEKGSAVNDVAENFQKLSHSAGMLATAVLPRLRDAVAGTINDFELMRRANEALRAGLTPDQFIIAAKAARTLADQVGGSTSEALNQLSQDLIRGTDRQLKFLGITVENVKAETEAERVTKTRALAIEELNKVLARSGPVALDSADGLDRLRAALQNQANASAAALAQNEGLNLALNTLASIASSIDLSQAIWQATAVGQAFDAAAKLIREFNELFGSVDQNLSAGAGIGAIVGMAPALDDLKRAANGVPPALNKISSAEKTAKIEADRLAEAQRKLNLAIRSATGRDGIAELDAKLRKLALAWKANEIGAGQLHEEIQKIGQGASVEGLDTLGDRVTTVFNDIERESEEAANKAKEEMEDAAKKSAEEWEDFAGDVESSISNAIGDSLDAAINGGDFKQIGKDLAKDLGRDLGEYLGGEIGAALGEDLGGEIGGEIGAALGEMVFDAFDHAFGGGRDPGAKARKSIDAWFAEIFNANRLTVIVNGELQKIKDLVFSASGDSSEFESGTFDDAFATLPAAAMEAFNGVGAAYEALLEEMGINTEEISGQLAAILFNNIGGSISDLRLLIEATGQSAEAMADALIEAFLEGSMSAIELARNLRGLEQTLQKGIPEGIGRVDIAWQRMVDAGFEGGRALFDAIQSIAIEAQELGASTMPELANIMIGTFGIAADQVEIFMQAMAAAGINSLADLANASNATLAAIAGNMQAIQQGEPDRFKPVQISRPTSSFGGGGGGGSSVSRGPSEAQRAAEQKRDDKRDKFESLRDLVLGTDEYTQALEKLAAGTLSIMEIDTIYNDLHKEALRLTNQLAKAEDKAQKQIDKKGKVSAETARRIAELREAIETLGDVTEQSNETTGEFISINEELFDFLGKFKDDLNAIQLAADLAGVSFKDLQAQAIAAFKAGELTATEALNRLGGGLTGSDADVRENFKRIKQGSAGGILSIDALRDLAGNILKGGGDSFEDIVRPLLEGGESLRNVQDLFIALSKTGIDSLDELSKVSDEKAIEIFAELEGLGFSFDEVTDATIRLRNELNQIPTSKKVDIEINAIMDEETRRILKQLGLLEKITTKTYGKNSPGLKPPSVGPG